METTSVMIVALALVMGRVRLSCPRHDRRDVVCQPAPIKVMGCPCPFPGHPSGLMVGSKF